MVIMGTELRFTEPELRQEENVKKILLGLFVVAMIIGLTACSQDLASKMGANMHKMGNNIYGIKANMTEVSKATGAVDASVDSEGNVDINKAADIMKKLDGIKKSEQKTEALRQSLQESAGTTNEKLAASIEDTKTALASKVATLEDGNQKTVANVILSALNSVEDSVSADPTKAEVATVAILNEMAKVVTDLTDDSIENLAAQGQEALDALLIVSGLGSTDLLADLNLQTFFGGNSGSKAAGDSSDGNLLQNLVAVLVKFVCVDGKFDQIRFNSFVLQAKTLRAAYEMISLKYIRNATSINDYDALLNINFSHGLDAEDLAKYLLSWLFIELNDILGNNVIGSTLDAMISPANYDKFTNLANPNLQIDDEAMHAASTQFINAAFLAFGINIDAIINFSLPTSREIFDDELLEEILADKLTARFEAEEIAKEEENRGSLMTDEEKEEFLNTEEINSIVTIAVADAMAEGGEYAVPFNPSYEIEPVENEAEIRELRTTTIRGYLTEKFGCTEDEIQEAMDAKLKSAKESDMLFMVLSIVFQVSEILNPETGAEKIADLGDAVKALPGDFMRFVGTSVVILRDSEWDGALLSLAKVPSNEQNKVSFFLKSTTNSLLGIEGGEE